MGTMTHSVLRATFDDKGNPTGQERMIPELGQRLRDLRVGPDGSVYLLTDETFGVLAFGAAIAASYGIVVARNWQVGDLPHSSVA
jgi:hypothetical protein